MLSHRTRMGGHTPFRLFVSAASCLALSGAIHPIAGATVPRPLQQPGANKAAGVRLAYDFKPGSSRHYKVTAFFTGHFPPFAQPGSKPINLLAELEYVAAVKSQDAKGAVVSFSVVSADINILQKDPGPDGKIDPNEELPFPLPLTDAKNSLDVTALLKPDGSIVEIKSGIGAPVKINFGIEPRKLFLLIFPMTFPNHAVALKENWTFDDGLLGRSAGKTKYEAYIDSIMPGAKGTQYRFGENVTSTVDDKVDKEGNSTTKAEEAVGTLTGTVTATGDILFLAPTATTAGATAAGRVSEGKVSLTVKLLRVMPDPDQPDKKEETPIDVKARLVIQELPSVKKAAAR